MDIQKKREKIKKKRERKVVFFSSTKGKCVRVVNVRKNTA
jgi:hypothetical protein